jgi:drug/metabolite transporter (DMT)-like permease
MKTRELGDLVLLGALWGASFLFMRVATPAFGPVALIALRVGLAAAILVPLALAAGHGAVLRRRAGSIAWMGLSNSALPFVLFACATLSLTAGFAALLNATAPMWTALLAWVWLGERIARARVLGLLLGMAGVAVLVGDRVGLRADAHAALLAMGAGLLATLCYGYAANYTRRRLSDVPPLAAAAGSQAGSALMLAPFAVWTWPAELPGLLDWLAVLGLGVFCTALAYVLYFRLIQRVGPTGAVSVTFLIPMFALLWGALFLGEGLSGGMALGGVIVLLGTALATGVLGRGEPRAREAGR